MRSVVRCHRLARPFIVALFIALALCTQLVTAQEIVIDLPTGSRGLLEGGDSVYFQSTGGVRADSWKSGTYGYVRNPRRSRGEDIFTRFHEGIDVKPLYRDERGVPLDSVRAIAEGRVAHICTLAGQSNYGKYVVVEHIWHGSPYYSLYAHLNDVWVTEGARVAIGEPLGRLGYTGAGINRTRAHLHLEVGLLLNGDFDEWFAAGHPREVNHNGVFNGHNLAGVDVPRLFREASRDPHVTIARIVASAPPFFQLHLPAASRPDLLSRYPWLLSRPADGDTRSWVISFTRAGLPLCVEPSADSVAEAYAVRLDRGAAPCRFLSRSGKDGACALSPFGRTYVDMLTTTRESLEQISSR